MKLIRIAVVVIFLLSTITLMGYRRYEANNKDDLGPKIEYEGDSISLSISASEKEILRGVTAVDNKDGDVGPSLLIEKTSNFASKGKRTITYAAFDSNNNVTKRERELVYTDYVSPRFKLSRPLSFTVGEGDEILKSMSVQDCIDGDLTDKIKYESIDYNFGQEEGSYPLEFQVTNSAGDTAYLPTEVEFRYPDIQNQNRIPEILLNEYIIYIKVGGYYDARSYLKSAIIKNEEYSFQDVHTKGINVKTISKNNVTITSSVEPKVPGVYQNEYSLTEDGYTGTTKLIVVVEE